MRSHAGKVCVVTGAGRGIGRQVALTLAAEGAAIVAAARSLDELGSLKAEIEMAGGICSVVRADVTLEDDVAAIARQAEARHGGIDIWVNNAGGFTPGSNAEWIDAPVAAISDMWNLNLTAQVLGAQAAARSMRARGKGGVIVFMSSIAGMYSTAGGDGIYGACKAALNHITQTMAIELGQYRIRVNALAPAIIETALTEMFFKNPGDREARLRLYPMGRFGKASDVASAVSFLASDEAEWISGAVLLMSGGAAFTFSPQNYLSKLRQQ